LSAGPNAQVLKLCFAKIVSGTGRDDVWARIVESYVGYALIESVSRDL